ncbi:hypothetical protein MuYL_0027 [Mucilaginibacter xinganensis]|uniref:Uncharacterized protein n=1 Tax=Mucilaginibacter xinganensis TaxID=1234841 RepID=A0A223NQ97_9SPHI|nr:hypothetical protein MuYL_0027 [Mucilaginibacter xinganensis]
MCRLVHLNKEALIYRVETPQKIKKNVRFYKLKQAADFD